MRGPTVLLFTIASVAAALLLFLLVGPRRLDTDVLAALVIGTLLGGTLDAVLPVLVRFGNRVMRASPDGR